MKMSSLMRVRDCVSCVLAALVSLGAAGAAGASGSEPVLTKSGLLAGVPGRDPAITVYKGVRFAAPPVGSLRWQPPQPPAAWQGVRTADHFGDACPQTPRAQEQGAESSASFSEDCLFLNLWSGAHSSKERRPVLVWFFGGGYAVGSGSSAEFDGEGLARKGVIVVTMNYRLGILGFMASPELSAGSPHHVSGNYGILDKLACLRWVRDNIAAFGGDPARVTIAGQSSGGESVLLLNGSPMARGLYQRAVAESAARFPRDPALPGHPVFWRSRKQAEGAGIIFAEAQGATSLRQLRAIPWEQFKDSNVPLAQFRPYFDGWVLPQGFHETYSSGLQNKVPFMVGFNRDELLGPPERLPAQTLEAYRRASRAKYGALAEEFLKLYPAATDTEAVQVYNQSIRDAHRVSLYLFAAEWERAASTPVFTYFWTHAHPGAELARGVYHGSEIPYLFDNLYVKDLPWTQEDHAIADRMSSYLQNFVFTGDPNGKALAHWSKFQPGKPVTMELGDHFADIPIADPARLDFMKRYFQAQPAQ